MQSYYNRRVSPRFFTLGTLVLCNTKEVWANLPWSKFAPSWDGPYMIFSDMGKGCYNLVIIDGDNTFRVNVKYLKLWRDSIASGHTAS